MARLWRISVQRAGRFQSPFVFVLLNHLSPIPFEIPMVIATSEPSSCITPDVAAHLRNAGPAVPRGGRRALPHVDGTLVARTIRLESLAIQERHGGRLVVAPVTFTVLRRPEAFGVSGLLGADFLSRFNRITYEFGPPDTLLLEEP